MIFSFSFHARRRGRENCFSLWNDLDHANCFDHESCGGSGRAADIWSRFCHLALESVSCRANLLIFYLVFVRAWLAIRLWLPYSCSL